MLNTNFWAEYRHPNPALGRLVGIWRVRELFFDDNIRLFGVRVTLGSTNDVEETSAPSLFISIQSFNSTLEHGRLTGEQISSHYGRSTQWRGLPMRAVERLTSYFQEYVDNRNPMAGGEFFVNQNLFTFVENISPLSKDYGTFDPRIEEKTPEGDPYKLGTIVYDLKHTYAHLQEPSEAGKIIELLPHKQGQYYYLVDFLKQGEMKRLQSSLLPNSEFFDYYVTKDGYVSLNDCSGLFSDGEKFIKKGEYLYNRNQTVILHFITFKEIFSKIQPKTDDTPQKSTTVSNKQKPSSPLSGF